MVDPNTTPDVATDTSDSITLWKERAVQAEAEAAYLLGALDQRLRSSEEARAVHQRIRDERAIALRKVAGQ